MATAFQIYIYISKSNFSSPGPPEPSLKDVWNQLKGNYMEYTYFGDNYGSRLDRIYAGEIRKNLDNIVTKPIPFSDHHGVIVDINLNMDIKMGKFYWKLNTKLLEDEYIEDEFRNG